MIDQSPLKNPPLVPSYYPPTPPDLRPGQALKGGYKPIIINNMTHYLMGFKPPSGGATLQRGGGLYTGCFHSSIGSYLLMLAQRIPRFWISSASGTLKSAATCPSEE